MLTFDARARADPRDADHPVGVRRAQAINVAVRSDDVADRALVEEAGMLYIDNYPATYDAVFQRTPHAIKFAKNSAFHYLNAGRYLMAQILMHTLRLLAPAGAGAPSHALLDAERASPAPHE